MDDVETLIENITKALSFKYPNDKWMPGVTIAYLNNRTFYVSLVRYCPGKKVIVKSSHAELLNVLEDVAKKFLNLSGDSCKPTPIDILRDSVGDRSYSHDLESDYHSSSIDYEDEPDCFHDDYYND